MQDRIKRELGRNIQVLLIEDDPEDTMLLMNMMSKPGWPTLRFTMLCAEDLRSGLDLLAKNQVEVVLLDLMLPDSQGIETVRRLRAKAPDLPVVVLTGMNDDELGLEALHNGAQDYQAKGRLDEHSLKRTLSYAVERHRLVAGLKNIIDAAKDGMLVVDASSKVRYANPSAAALFGRPLERLIGETFPHPLPQKREGELKFDAPEGERTIELRLSEISWQNEPAWLVTARDLTDLRRIEQLKAEVRERQRMDKLKDELMSAVSHEMRTPLTVIKAISSNLMDDVKHAALKRQAHLIEMQYKNVLRLQKIVDNILNLARLESGRASIHVQKLDVRAAIADTVGGLRLVAKEHGLGIDEEIPKSLPPAYGDLELFIQVLSNLIDNAVRFAKTHIIVAARESSGTIEVSVIDDGVGIPADRLPDLFNKFVQVNRSSHGEGYRGTGLGLAICKEIVERQNGRIWVESKEGRGSGFHFCLPLHRPGADDDVQGGSHAQDERKAPRAHGR